MFGLTHVPRLVPAKETDDGPRRVSDYARPEAEITVAGTVPDVRRLPPSPAALHRGNPGRWGANCAGVPQLVKHGGLS